jgi:hypothetical protein
MRKKKLQRQTQIPLSNQIRGFDFNNPSSGLTDRLCDFGWERNVRPSICGSLKRRETCGGFFLFVSVVAIRRMMRIGLSVR